MKISPKKRFSQNFLKNEEISKKIAALVSKKNILIEVGPGTGCLTKHLFEHKNLHLVEIDLDCVNFLKRKFPQIKEKIKNEVLGALVYPLVLSIVALSIISLLFPVTSPPDH